MTSDLHDTSQNLTLRCRCGQFEMVAAHVAPAVANRITCACDGCRSFAERMDPTLLDEYGATERMQVTPACLSITSGPQFLSCQQQTAKGALRWVASCCGTPLGLTLSSNRVPFVGLDVKRVGREQLTTLSAVIGPVRARVNGRYPRGERRALRADIRSLLAMLGHLMPLTWRWWRSGDQRRSPFFLPSGEPAAEVQKLYDELPVPRETTGP